MNRNPFLYVITLVGVFSVLSACQSAKISRYYAPRKDSVQVLLFLTDKPANVAMATEVPYFTTVVPGKSKTCIPFIAGKPTLVLAYDRRGNQVE